MTPIPDHSTPKKPPTETEIDEVLRFEYRGFTVEVGLRYIVLNVMRLRYTNFKLMEVVAVATKQDDPYAGATVEEVVGPSFWSYLTLGLIAPDIESMAATATEKIQANIDRWDEEPAQVESAIERGIDTTRRQNGKWD